MTPMLFRARNRVRGWYLFAFIVTMVIGLASRRFPEMFPAVLGKYPGDALWSLMVFFGFGLVFSTQSSARIAAYALTTSIVVEILKLWQANGLVEFRHTPLGHLLLGQVFSWNNLLAYAVGIVVGLTIESLVRPLNKPAAH